MKPSRAKYFREYYRLNLEKKKAYNKARDYKRNRDYEDKKYLLYKGMKGRAGRVEIWKNIKLMFTFSEFLVFLEKSQYKKLFAAWEKNGYPHNMSPCVDRIDPKGNYDLNNIRIVTIAENTRRVIYKRKGSTDV